MKFVRKIIKWFKHLFNIPTYHIGCDPASKEGDYSCIVMAKYYPRTGIYEIVEVNHPKAR